MFNKIRLRYKIRSGSVLIAAEVLASESNRASQSAGRIKQLVSPSYRVHDHPNYKSATDVAK